MKRFSGWLLGALLIVVSSTAMAGGLSLVPATKTKYKKGESGTAYCTGWPGRKAKSANKKDDGKKVEIVWEHEKGETYTETYVCEDGVFDEPKAGGTSVTLTCK